MSKIEKIEDCRKGSHVLKLAETVARERADVEIKYTGSHPTLKVRGKGSMPLPVNHGSKQLGKGLLCALCRQWKLLGLAAIALLILCFI